MQYLKISVVTPNYNQAAFLERTIQSVLAQGYPNLEYIIIDGGSNDGSVEIIKKYADKLFYWVSEPDTGMYDAIQKGFSISNGDVMTYINSDDLLQPYSLFTANSIFSKYSDIHWINGIPNIIDEYNRLVLVGTLPNWSKYHYLTGQYRYIQQEGIFWTRNLWERAGSYIDASLSLAGDLELWSRFFLYEELYYLPLLLGSFRRRRSGQKTIEQLDSYHREADHVIQRMKPSNEFDKKIIKKYYSIPWKILRRFNRKKLYTLFGYLDIYNIFLNYQSKFEFDRTSQELILKKSEL